MQQAYRPPNAGKVAFLNGLYFGLGAAVLNVIILVVQLLGINLPGIIFLVLGWLCGLAAFFLAGMFAAKKTGRVGTATLAGLWAAIFNGVITNGVYGVIVFVALSFGGNAFFRQVATTMPATLSPDEFSSVVRFVMVMVLTFCVLANIGIGAGVAPLGGLIGRSMAPKQPQDPANHPQYAPPYGQYPGQPPFPPYPYPGQPPYPAPGQPPYGGQPPYPAPGQPPYPAPPAQPEPQRQYQPYPDAEQVYPYGDEPARSDVDKTLPAHSTKSPDNEK